MHLSTTKCCNHEFTVRDMEGRFMSQEQALGTNDLSLYGGNVKKFANTKCPECGKPYTLWLKPHEGSYKVLTISEPVKVKRTKRKSTVK